MVAVALVAATAGEARGQFGPWKGGASLHLDARYGRVDGAAAGDGRDHHAAVGLDLRAAVGRGAPVLYAAGLGYQFGATVPGGFVYEVDLYPVGVGVLPTHNVSVAVRAGVGMSGTTGRVPLSAQFPVEAVVEFDLHRRVRVAGWVRPSWLTTDARHDGSARASFADELSAGLAVRWGRRYFPHQRNASAGNGYYLAALYREQLGARVVGGAFGYSINVAGGRL